MGPNHPFSEVNPIHDAAVKTENIIQHPAGTSGNDQRVDAFIGNIFFKEFDPGLTA